MFRQHSDEEAGIRTSVRAAKIRFRLKLFHAYRLVADPREKFSRAPPAGRGAWWSRPGWSVYVAGALPIRSETRGMQKYSPPSDSARVSVFPVFSANSPRIQSNEWLNTSTRRAARSGDEGQGRGNGESVEIRGQHDEQGRIRECRRLARRNIFFGLTEVFG